MLLCRIKALIRLGYQPFVKSAFFGTRLVAGDEQHCSPLRVKGEGNPPYAPISGKA